MDNTYTELPLPASNSSNKKSQAPIKKEKLAYTSILVKWTGSCTPQAQQNLKSQSCQERSIFFWKSKNLSIDFKNKMPDAVNRIDFFLEIVF